MGKSRRSRDNVARVVFPDSFAASTGGEREIETNAATVRDLLIELRARWPGVSEQLERSAVAIDGQIYQDAFMEPIAPDSEVFFMARIEGG